MADTLTAPPQTDRLTFADFVTRDDERKADLIDGYLCFDMPTDRHENLFAFLIAVLRYYVDERELGQVRGSRTPIRIAERRGFEPDLVFVRAERAHIIEDLYLSAAPDLAVEIVSPSSVRRDYETKYAAYEEIGVREYWLVDPVNEQARFYLLGEDGLFGDATPPAGAAFESSVLTGFRVAAEVLLAEPLPKVSSFLREVLG